MNFNPTHNLTQARFLHKVNFKWSPAGFDWQFSFS